MRNKKGQKISIPVKIDTVAFRSSVDRTLAADLGLLEEENILLWLGINFLIPAYPA